MQDSTNTGLWAQQDHCTQALQVVRVRALASSAPACLGVSLLHHVLTPVFWLGRAVGFPWGLRSPVLSRGLSALPCDLFLLLPRKLWWSVHCFLFYLLCGSCRLLFLKFFLAFLKNYFIVLCVLVFCLYILYMQYVCAWCLWKLEERLDFPGTTNTDCC